MLKSDWAEGDDQLAINAVYIYFTNYFISYYHRANSCYLLYDNK